MHAQQSGVISSNTLLEMPLMAQCPRILYMGQDHLHGPLHALILVISCAGFFFYIWVPALGPVHFGGESYLALLGGFSQFGKLKEWRGLA